VSIGGNETTPGLESTPAKPPQSRVQGRQAGNAVTKLGFSQGRTGSPGIRTAGSPSRTSLSGADPRLALALSCSRATQIPLNRDLSSVSKGRGVGLQGPAVTAGRHGVRTRNESKSFAALLAVGIRRGGRRRRGAELDRAYNERGDFFPPLVFATVGGGVARGR
jgi:hypothetical protein